MATTDHRASLDVYKRQIESYIVPGCQTVGEGVYGKSIPDPCLGWEESEQLIYEIADLC